LFEHTLNTFSFLGRFMLHDRYSETLVIQHTVYIYVYK